MFRYLPEELEPEILSRVPATSLSQWLTTCKRWCGLFKDQRFIKKNLDIGKSARQVVLLNDRRIYSVGIDLHGINNNNHSDPSLELTAGNLKSLKDKDREEVKMYEMFHCDGLFLCTTCDYRLVLWNPCTGQTRWIQSDKPSSINHKYFLGYQENEKSWHRYKILRISTYKNCGEKVFEFGIYEMESDSWKVLDDVNIDWNMLSVGVSLKGNTYWVATDQEPNDRFILKFDFATASFGWMSLPFESEDGDDETLVLSVVGEEKLALLCQSFDAKSLRMKIWVTTNNKINEAQDLSWSDFLEVDFLKLRITCMASVFSFLVDEEMKMVVCCDTGIKDKDQTRIYIVGEKMHKQVYKDTTFGSYFYKSHLVSYVPSLVQIPTKGNVIMEAAEEKGDIA